MQYQTNRKRFFIIIGVLVAISLLIQLITIFTNDLVASYLVDQDEYWSVYYYKPYTRIHGYFIGVFLGCEYFKFKYKISGPQNDDIDAQSEQSDASEQKSKMDQSFESIRDSKKTSFLCILLGVILQQMMIQVQKKINNNPGQTSFFTNLMYLILARPVFVIGFVLITLPLILGNPLLRPILRLMNHEYWVFVSRLVFGVFLCNTIFLQYHIFNTERGLILEKLDTALLSLSFMTLSFLFSFILYLLIDGPCSLLVSKFIKLDNDIYSDVDSQTSVSS